MMNCKRYKAIFLFSLLAVTFSFSFATALAKSGEGYITARGLAAIRNPEQDPSMHIAREKARMRADVALLGKLKRLKVTTDVSVEDILENRGGQIIHKRKVKGTLRGAHIIQEGRVSTGLYEVIIGIPMAQLRANLPPSLGNVHRQRKYIDSSKLQ